MIAAPPSHSLISSKYKVLKYVQPNTMITRRLHPSLDVAGKEPTIWSVICVVSAREGFLAVSEVSGKPEFRHD